VSAERHVNATNHNSYFDMNFRRQTLSLVYAFTTVVI